MVSLQNVFFRWKRALQADSCSANGRVVLLVVQWYVDSVIASLPHTYDETVSKLIVNESRLWLTGDSSPVALVTSAKDKQKWQKRLFFVERPDILLKNVNSRIQTEEGTKVWEEESVLSAKRPGTLINNVQRKLKLCNTGVGHASTAMMRIYDASPMMYLSDEKSVKWTLDSFCLIHLSKNRAHVSNFVKR